MEDKIGFFADQFMRDPEFNRVQPNSSFHLLVIFPIPNVDAQVRGFLESKFRGFLNCFFNHGDSTWCKGFNSNMHQASKYKLSSSNVRQSHWIIVSPWREVIGQFRSRLQ
ncbi:hypothetical protein E6O75_ATG01570 [Venturia nashicola]|uniref:Uncharacterized protein n=1 Tax=Venturia nashicola TaxID=86259 RepID=A0A4Z1PUX2_9PEZI|nr:hypothetical protein E6O75_ATG01570 [Venturia nashicola]